MFKTQEKDGQDRNFETQEMESQYEIVILECFYFVKEMQFNPFKQIRTVFKMSEVLSNGEPNSFQEENNI